MDLVTSTAFSPGVEPDGAFLDQVLVEPRFGLLAVADAPSGGEDGRAGVRISLDSVRRHLDRNADLLDRFRSHPAPELRARVMAVLEEAFARASQEVFAFARRRRGLMVAMDVVLVIGKEAFIGHVGDGRVYLVRRGLVHQLTIDHAQAGEDGAVFERADDPTEETAMGAGGRTFTRALGPMPSVRVESLLCELVAEDRIVVTAAPLYRALPENVLHTLLVTESLDSLGPALTRAAERRPVVAVLAQLGGGEAFKQDLARARLAIIAPMPLFAHCTERELRSVAAATRPTRLESGRILFSEGDPGEELYLLIAGRVRIERKGQVLATLGPGSNFGEMAMLDERTRSATALTLDDCELLVIHRDAFFALLRTNPMLAMKILWNMLLRLSSNLRNTSARLAELQFAKTPVGVVVDGAPAQRRTGKVTE
jgi:CRP-like cAMP-binding protein/serine/threonine protein phosphatase PrpC